MFDLSDLVLKCTAVFLDLLLCALLAGKLHFVSGNGVVKRFFPLLNVRKQLLTFLQLLLQSSNAVIPLALYTLKRFLSAGGLFNQCGGGYPV